MSKLIFSYFPDQSAPENRQVQKQIFRISLVIPTLFVVVFFLVRLIDAGFHLDLWRYGVYPRHADGLKGILCSPFIHGDFKHLANNSVTFIVLGTALFFFYRKISFQVFILNYLLSGFILWAIGRESLHIGASGVIYGMAAFLFLSGIFRRDIRLLTISLVVTFLYGSLIWGLLPIDPRMSWDGHLAGALSGVLLALWYKNQGLPRIQSQWDEETDPEEDDGEEQDQYWKIPEQEESSDRLN